MAVSHIFINNSLTLPFLYRYGKVFIQAWQVTDSTRILYTPINKIEQTMKQLTRITLDPEVMGGKPCIRGLRVTVGTVVGLLASGHSIADILNAYPYLEEEDIHQALAYAAWRVEELELPLNRCADSYR